MTIKMNTRPKQTLTLAEYVRRRTGVSLGGEGSLRNMLQRSLGARSFAGFWQYWNPIFGYGLGRYIFTPLKRLMPAAPALLITFLFNGFLHDLVTTAVRGSIAVLFTPWFFFLGIGVLVGQQMKMDLSDHPWSVRAAIHLVYLALCFLLALGVSRSLP